MKDYIRLLSIFIIGAFFACEKDVCKERICGQLDPINNIDWLKNALERRPFCTYVYSFRFSNREYISIEDCPGPDHQIDIYDCNGEDKCEIGGYSGGSYCNMPSGFTYDYYMTNKKLIYEKP